MSDIVERLRNASYENAPSRCMEAADEIERLRGVYESAVKGRAQFREAYREALKPWHSTEAHSPAESDLAAKLKRAHQNNLALWQAIAGGPEPRCRDCADFNGKCQGNGLPCDPQERALERVRLLRSQVEEGITRVKEACDLLAERTHGNPARSPGHNARLRLEGWTALSSTQQNGAAHD